MSLAKQAASKLKATERQIERYLKDAKKSNYDLKVSKEAYTNIATYANNAVKMFGRLLGESRTEPKILKANQILTEAGIIDESTDIATIKNTGTKGTQILTVNQFSAGKDKGIMLQVTQGPGKYVQISKDDAKKLSTILAKWAKAK